MFRSSLSITLVPPVLFGACAFTLSSCSSDDRPARVDKVSLVSDAAGKMLDAFASGDYPGSWDALDSTSQQIISRREWVRLYTVLCRPVTEGLAFTVQDVRVTGARSATVRIERGGVLSLWPVVFEDGRWRPKMPDDLAKGFQAETVEELAADWRTLGLCKDGGQDQDLDVDLHLKGGPRLSAKASPKASVKTTVKASPKATVKATVKTIPRPAYTPPPAPPKTQTGSGTGKTLGGSGSGTITRPRTR